MYWSLTALVCMLLGSTLELRRLRRGGAPSPRFWLLICWLAVCVFAAQTVVACMRRDDLSWLESACLGGVFVATLTVRSATVRAAVRAELEANPDGIYGLDLWKASRVAPGSLYPLLFRWERQGVVRSWWGEQPDDGGPRRRYYALAEETPRCG